MKLQDVVKFRIEKIKGKSLEEQKNTINSIYTDMEKVGYHHTEIFVTINSVIQSNLTNLNKKLKEIL